MEKSTKAGICWVNKLCVCWVKYTWDLHNQTHQGYAESIEKHGCVTSNKHGMCCIKQTWDILSEPFDDIWAF